MLHIKSIATLAISAAAVLGFAVPASADVPGQHPFYVHALADLRYAHSLIARPSFVPGVDRNEDVALADIDHAYRAIRAAGYDDGKDINDWASADPGLDRRGRLDRALQALGDAHGDVTRVEQNPGALGARAWGVRDIDGAIWAVRRARFDERSGF